MHFIKTRFREIEFFIFCFLCFFLISCQSPNTANDYIKSYENSKEINPEELFKEELEDKDANFEMYLLEKGRLAQLNKRYDVSKNAFSENADALKSREIKEDTLPGADINVGSVFVNDNLLPYKPRLYEVKLLHLYQLYNYLATGDMEGAMVEARLINYIVTQAEKARADKKFSDDEEIQAEKKLNKDEQKNKDQYQGKIQKAYDQNLKKMAEVLAKTKSSVLNPYAIYLSGVIHEMNKEYDSAYINYKKSLELMPENPYIQKSAMRMAVFLDRYDDYKIFEQKYPEIWLKFKNYRSSSDNGRLIVIYEEGWVPQKKEEMIDLGVVSIAYPVYDFQWLEARPLRVFSSNGEIGSTYPFCYMGALALRSLQEESTWRIARQASRASVKASAVAAGATASVIGAASNDPLWQFLGALAFEATVAYNKMSESADLRSWRTLPENAQILDEELPKGEHELTFKPQNSSMSLKEKVIIAPGKTTILWIIRSNSRLFFERIWPPETNQVKNR